MMAASACDHRGPDCTDLIMKTQFVLIYKAKKIVAHAHGGKSPRDNANHGSKDSEEIWVLIETLRFQPIQSTKFEDAVARVRALGWLDFEFRCLGSFQGSRCLYAFVPSRTPLQLAPEGVPPEPDMKLYGPYVWVPLASLFAPRRKLFHATSSSTSSSSTIVPSLRYVLETLAGAVLRREYVILGALKSDEDRELVRRGTAIGDGKNDKKCGAGDKCSGLGDTESTRVDPLGGHQLRVCTQCYERRSRLAPYCSPVDEEPYCTVCLGMSIDEKPVQLCRCGCAHPECKVQEFIRRVDEWELWDGFLPCSVDHLVAGSPLDSESAWRRLIESPNGEYVAGIAFRREPFFAHVRSEEDRMKLLHLLDVRGRNDKTHTSNEYDVSDEHITPMIHHDGKLNHIVLHRGTRLAEKWIPSDVKVKSIPFDVPFLAPFSIDQAMHVPQPMMGRSPCKVMLGMRWEPTENVEWMTLRRPVEKRELDVRWITPKCEVCQDALAASPHERDLCGMICAERIVDRAVWRQRRRRPYLGKENVCILSFLTKTLTLVGEKERAHESALSLLALAEETFGAHDVRLLQVLPTIVDAIKAVERDPYVLRAMHLAQTTYWHGYVLDEATGYVEKIPVGAVRSEQMLGNTLQSH